CLRRAPDSPRTHPRLTRPSAITRDGGRDPDRGGLIPDPPSSVFHHPHAPRYGCDAGTPRAKNPLPTAYSLLPTGDPHGLAQSAGTLWCLFLCDGGDRVHAPVSAAVLEGARPVGPRHRDHLDAGGARRLGAVPGRALVRPDRPAQAVPGGRAG